MKILIALAFLLCAAPALQAQLATHVDEDFDAGIPSTWSVIDVACPATNWQGTLGGYKGNYLDGTEFAFIDSDAAGQFCMVEDYLVSPPFDASSASSLVLEFDHYFRFWTTGKGTVQVFDGTSWVDVASYAANTGAWGAPDHPVLDLSTWANASMQVRFKYIGNWDWWWAVDNVLVYEPLPPPVVYCTAKPNSLGCLPAIGFSGTPSVSSPAPFDITATGILNNKLGMLFYGNTGPDALPFQGGFLCVKSPILRTSVQSSAGNPPPLDCSGSFSFDFNAWIQGGGDPLLTAGHLVHAQYWFRDPGSPEGTGLTDAIELTIGP